MVFFTTRISWIVVPDERHNPRATRVGMVVVFKGCVVCKGKQKRRRNGKGGNTCTANECKRVYKEQRANRSTEQDGAAGALSTSEKMPDGMSVHELHEILGERCCEQYKLTKKKRKNGPGNSYCQEFLVRGTFLQGDDTDDEQEDEMPEPNMFWVEKADLLETIDAEDVKTALTERHECVLRDVDAEE